MNHNPNHLVQGCAGAAVTADRIQPVTPQADAVLVWVVIGLAFLWVLGSMAETTLAKIRPVLMFLVVAGFVGVLVVHMFHSL